jgi:Cd2+/Zn2+-exporting ATPase
MMRLCPPGGPGSFLPLVPLLAAWLLAGLPVLKKALENLRRLRGLDENFLMSLATVGAFAVGEWEEAVGVMIFYMIGEMIQDAAVDRSRSSINALLALKPDTARVKAGDDWAEVPASSVEPGTLVLVRPGERIPLDGVLSEGTGSIDASMLSGESLPVACAPGDEVRSGTVSLDGVLLIRTTRTAENSSAARIVALVESAREAKARPERFITAFARWYTPLVVGAAVLIAFIPPLFLPGFPLGEWVYRALILLVISCPCALVVSVPLGYFAGIGGLSRRGIMVKGAVHLDSLCKAKNLVFDKTGTLTRGEFTITALEPAPGIEGDALLETAVLAEGESNHPIAEAVRRGGRERGIGAAEAASWSRREIAGRGLEITGEGQSILAGNRQLLEERGIPLPAFEESGARTPVYIARDGRCLGRLLIGDSLREGAAEALRELKALGIQNTAIFTGDTRGSAEEAAARLGIDRVAAELLPQDKLAELEELSRTGPTVFVGDGINDAPVLARSDVGIAMGSGADAAVEAGDIIIMGNDPRRVPEAISRARKTRRIVMENVIFALGAKGLFIGLAVMGMANMWIALAADVGVALAAILNSTRALR